MYGTPLIWYTLPSDASEFNVTGISQSYKHLYIIWSSRQNADLYGPQSLWFYNANTNPGGNYGNTAQYAYEGGQLGFGYGPENYIRQRASARTSAGPNIWNIHRTLIPNYSSTNTHKMILTDTIAGWAPDTLDTGLIINCWSVNDAMSSIRFGSNWGPLIAGNFVAIYGVN